MRYVVCLLTLLAVGVSHGTEVSMKVPDTSSISGKSGTMRESVGIETLGGVFTPLLQKGCRIPCVLTQTFSTAEDNQDQIVLHLYRGNSKMTSGATYLGDFQISGISPMPRGIPKISVSLTVDGGGLSLSASDGVEKSRLSVGRVSP